MNINIYIYIYISADPCRQQGERVRGEITSSGGRGPHARSVHQGVAVLGRGPQARSVRHGVLALRQGPWTRAWTGAGQNESQLQEDTSRVAVGSAENAGKDKVWS